MWQIRFVTFKTMRAYNTRHAALYGPWKVRPCALNSNCNSLRHSLVFAQNGPTGHVRVCKGWPHWPHVCTQGALRCRYTARRPSRQPTPLYTRRDPQQQAGHQLCNSALVPRNSMGEQTPTPGAVHVMTRGTCAPRPRILSTHCVLPPSGHSLPPHPVPPRLPRAQLPPVPYQDLCSPWHSFSAPCAAAQWTFSPALPRSAPPPTCSHLRTAPSLAYQVLCVSCYRISPSRGHSSVRPTAPPRPLAWETSVTSCISLPAAVFLGAAVTPLFGHHLDHGRFQRPPASPDVFAPCSPQRAGQGTHSGRFLAVASRLAAVRLRATAATASYQAGGRQPACIGTGKAMGSDSGLNSGRYLQTGKSRPCAWGREYIPSARHGHLARHGNAWTC